MKQITRQIVREYLPKRGASAHKGNFGRILVIAGSRTMCGAGFLCALSALRAGAGLVAWGLPQSMQPSFAAMLPEVITCPLSETSKGVLAAKAQVELQTFCEHFRPTLIACGCGMGKSPLLQFILEKTRVPLVLDADGLNFLAEHLEIALSDKYPCILTPHPGEMARLLTSPVATNEQERLMQVQACYNKYKKVTVLKGAGTLVSFGRKILQNPTGNVALAKGGSGDVLTGIIAGLWGQLGSEQGFTDLSAWKAALCGVYVHGLAGDLASQENTTYGVLARDIINKIPEAIYQILKVGRTK